MTYNKINFYHVTTAANFYKIIDAGLIDPAFATGKRKVCWYVKFENVPWAVAHVIRRHNVGLDKVVVLKVQASEFFLHQMGGGIMWATKRSLKPIAHDSGASWLVRDELRMLKLEAEIEGIDWYEHLKE